MRNASTSLRPRRLGALLPLIAVTLALPVGAAFGQGVPSAAPIRVAVANPSKIFNEMQETKALQGRLAEDQKKFEAGQRERKAQLEELKRSRDALLPNHPQHEELNGQLIKAGMEFKVWMESQRAIAEHAQKKQMKQLFEKIQTAIGEVAQRDGYDLILADNKDPLPSDQELEQVDVRALRGAILQKDVLFAGGRVDVSQAVLALLDARYKAAGGVAPTAAAPAAPGAAPVAQPASQVFPGAAPAPAAALPPRAPGR